MGMNKEEKLKELIDALGIDTTCEISFKHDKGSGFPTLNFKGTGVSLCAGLQTLLVECMETMKPTIKERLDLLSVIYMNAKEEIIDRGERNEEIEETN